MTTTKLVRRTVKRPASSTPTKKRERTVTQPQQPTRRLVPLDKRAPGWLKVDASVVDTDYEVTGVTVIGLATDCGGYRVGWDMCGLCTQHIRHCRCQTGAVPPAWVVYCYRSAHKISYPSGMRKGYIGLRHNHDGSVAPLVFDSPEARMAASTLPDDGIDRGDPVPAVSPTRQRRSQAAVPAVVPAPTRRRTRVTAASTAAPVSSKLVRRQPQRKGG